MARFYTDGASDQKTNSGYACVYGDRVIYGRSPLMYVDDVIISASAVNFIFSAGERFKPTNNRGELTAILIAAKIIRQNNLFGASIVTDSKYCIGIYTSWLNNWKSQPELFNGKANLDLILLTDQLLGGMEVVFVHQPAHKKVPVTRDERMNAIADKYAVMARLADNDGVISALE